VKVRDLIHLLESTGWRLKTTKGSHRQFLHPKKGMVVTVPGQPGKDVPVGNAEGYSSQCRTGKEGGELMTYTVIYEKGPTSWGAYVPDLPGVISVGDSRDEVERLIQEAIEFHLEGMREEGLTIPSPSSFAGVVEIDPAA